MTDKLPDYLESGLRLVFCGTAAGKKSAAVGGYYAGPGNLFWGTLYEVGLISEPLGPHLSHRILEFGIGLTDLAKDVAASSNRGLASSYDVAGFIAKIEAFEPDWVAFHGLEAATPVARVVAGTGSASLGPQSWQIASSRAFIVPSMSGSNRNPVNWGGRGTREAWFGELAELVGR